MDSNRGLRNENGSSISRNTSSNGSRNSLTNATTDPEVKLVVLGSRGVGKSAIIVRYLTRRFIGDYDPEMEAVFSHTTTVDGKRIVLHVMDTAWHVNGHSIMSKQKRQEDPILWADGFLLVFSLTDVNSWCFVKDLVSHLRYLRSNDSLPVAVAANKSELVHLWQVNSIDCATWCTDNGCVYQEVSAGEDPASVELVFMRLCRQVGSLHKKREKLSWIMQRPVVMAKLQLRSSLRCFAGKSWRLRTLTF